jgi:hypothetical protein
MRKVCSCGRDIPFEWSLCSGCLEIYGAKRNEWPKWLLFHINDLNREEKSNSRHDDIAYNDNYNYANIKLVIDGQHYTRKDDWGSYTDS